MTKLTLILVAAPGTSVNRGAARKFGLPERPLQGEGDAVPVQRHPHLVSNSIDCPAVSRPTLGPQVGIWMLR